jgi:NADH-ubiquinone oxidoreductase chain 1
MYLSFISCIFCYICILLAVAFFTLLERKGLSYIQKRKGPNKVGFVGLPQPLSDAIKLLTKEIAIPIIVNSLPFLAAPVLRFILALLLWQLYPSVSSLGFFGLGILFFLCVSRLNVYGTLVAGWASNSKYALLGSLRSIAQSISYEVSMVLILLFSLFLASRFDFLNIIQIQKFICFGFLFPRVFLIWFVTCIAETNRAPFDFAEGESELVSGFNIEYGRAGFALIFLAEYANILVIRLFRSILFLSGVYVGAISSDFLLILKCSFFAFVFI